jgi:hypothetical protein
MASPRLIKVYPAPDRVVKKQSDKERSSWIEAACLPELGRKSEARAFRIRSSTQNMTKAVANGTAVSTEAYMEFGGLGWVGINNTHCAPDACLDGRLFFITSKKSSWRIDCGHPVQFVPQDTTKSCCGPLPA